MSIPKVIHYCWYGNGSKPECFEKCFASWKKHAPDYEIIEWNESNTNLEENEFMKQAYAAKKYAFVSDIARLRILYDHGGVYLDTDVELSASLDSLLHYDAFYFLDNFGKIATGFGFGAKKSNPLIKEMLDDYQSYHFSAGMIKQLLCTDINTKTAQSFFPGFSEQNVSQYFDNYAFLSHYDYAKYACHHYTATWRSDEDFYAEKFKKTKWPLRKYHKYLRSPNIFALFRKLGLRKIEKLYSFFVFDFITYGLKYYAYKLYRKIYKKLFHIR